MSDMQSLMGLVTGGVLSIVICLALWWMFRMVSCICSWIGDRCSEMMNSGGRTSSDGPVSELDERVESLREVVSGKAMASDIMEVVSLDAFANKGRSYAKKFYCDFASVIRNYDLTRRICELEASRGRQEIVWEAWAACPPAFPAQMTGNSVPAGKGSATIDGISRHECRGGGDDAVDSMSGKEYERWIRDLIVQEGYEADLTKASSDQGVDVLVTVAGKRVAVQCKHYSQSVGNDAVQEVYAGKAVYKCSYACVVTNSTFTKSARDLARATGVKLLHHTQISDTLKQLEQKLTGTTW